MSKNRVPTISKFTKRLKKLRKEQRVDQFTVAEGIGVTRQCMSNYESGVRRPDYETLAKLAKFFGVTVDYLIGAEDIAPYEYSTNRRVLMRLLEYITEDEVGMLIRIVRAIWFPQGDFERDWLQE